MKLAWVYLALVAVGWLLGAVVGERTVPTLLLAYAPPVLWLLPAPFVLGAALWRRRGRRAALAGTLLALWGAGLLHWTPQREGELRVVTYNVLRGDRVSSAQLGQALRTLNAEVILLQESNFRRPGAREALAAALPGYRVVHAAEVTTLTRLPLLNVRRVPLPRHRREVLVTRLRWQGRPLTVVNAHLGTVQVVDALAGDWASLHRTRAAREEQGRMLTELAAQTQGPVLLGGDLNTPPRGRLWRQLRAAYGAGAHDHAGRGAGWTFPALKVRIDHVLSPDLRPARSRVLPWRFSDHRPLLTEWQPGPPAEAAAP
ncbi:endonuclease/exonuclease/phosphatase family protein [Deinococcus aquaedulcis]|uniref:endonuclease/exonuclease/phosphatase family protein n=1 Tax=Deinococcus aquaedulcis TaxID=2840455 RepID=UPI002E2E52E5|nr:endonuclease/exonuclease/phosphatase family protein [Deinococcus aquaedulcis]